MKTLMMKFGSMFAALALVVTTMNVNSTCGVFMYQEPVSENMKKLSKIND